MKSHPFLANTVLFVQLLRRAGLPVSSEQAMGFAHALTLVDVGSREQFYYAARCMLLTRHEHQDLFDALFNRFWGTYSLQRTARPQKAPRAPRHQQNQQPFLMSYMASRARAGDPEVDVVDKTGTFSAAELLQMKDFSQMTPEELDAIRRLMQQMRWDISRRRTRRRVPAARGNMLHLRRVLASAARSGGVPLKLAWQNRKIKPRPFILLADISGSMEKYSRLILQFFYSVSRSLKQVECFVFGTRLTRITHQLKLKNIDRALEEAAHSVLDWSGGTRIGESLGQFNRRWSRRVLGRGALVLVISDGWERGDPVQLAKELHYLQLRCYRLIWLNPLSGRVSYEPLVEGMSAAMPYIDEFLPVHNLQSLEALGSRLARLGTAHL